MKRKLNKLEQKGTWKKGMGTLLKGSRRGEKKGTFIGRWKVEEKAVETGRKNDEN